jgi:hypothetical protein
MHAWKSHCICRFCRIKIIDTDVSSLMQTNATATTCILQPSTKDGVAFRGMYIVSLSGPAGRRSGTRPAASADIEVCVNFIPPKLLGQNSK